MSHEFDAYDIDELRRRVRGEVHGPGDPGYPSVGFNPAVERSPAAVVDVLDADDIAATVRFAAAHGMTVGVFATGHGGTRLGARSILVRTAALDTCVVDAAQRTARVGAGVVWQTVIDAAVPLGLAPLCGSSPTVGVIGYLSGGGIGPLVSTFGSSADHVRSLTVVTGDGTVRTATPQENPELFWGLRGGKATLGIITEAVIDLPAISDIYGGAVYFDGADAATVIRAWRDWAVLLPDEASTSVALLNLPPLPGVPPMLAGRLTLAVRYASVTDAEAAAVAFAPIRAVATPLLDAVGSMPYAAIGAIHADPPGPMPVRERGGLLTALSDAAVDILVDVVAPPVGQLLPVVEIRALGGAYAKEPAVRSALCHRDAPFNLNIVGLLVDEDAARAVTAVVDATLGALAPWSAGGMLPNFAASDDPELIHTCYDADTAAWLAALGDQFDPHGVYRTGQVVRS